VGSIQVSHVGWKLPSGVELLRDVSFRVGDGERVALVGANGAGKSTLVRLVAGDTTATSGTITVDGRLGVMRQLVGMVGGDGPITVRDLLVSVAPERIQAVAKRLDAAHERIDTDPMRYATALGDWGDAGGYDIEVLWDVCTTGCSGAVRALPAPHAAHLSGGEQKRLALEALLRGEDEVLLLDEPDNYLDVRASDGSRRAVESSRKTVLLVSHDRELLAATATKVVTLEAEGAWTHGGGFATYHARERRACAIRLEELHKRWEEEKEPAADAGGHPAAAGAKISEVMAPSCTGR
jgi:ATPase subunit of ABC transporter with duplicated ATPase domains